MVIRIGLGLKPHVHERLTRVTVKFGIPQSRLLSAVVSVMSDDEVLSLLRRFDKVESIEREIRLVADHSMLGYMQGKSVGDLETMLNAAKNAGVKA